MPGAKSALLPLLVAVLALPALAQAPPAAPAGAEYWKAAKEIGDFLVKSARREGDALYWAQYDGGPKTLADGQRQYPLAFYNGVAGTGFFLLSLHRAMGYAAHLEAARGAGVRLVEKAEAVPGGGLKWRGTSERKGRTIPEAEGCGLYTGNAGIGVFLLHLFEATKDARFRIAAEGAFERVLKDAKAEGAGCCWEYAFQDVIGGEAGIGLALLEAHRLTGNPAYLAAARKAAAWLVSRASLKDDAAFWTTYGAADPNFSHGSAGIAFFLAALGDAGPRKAALAGAKWVESQGKPCEGGAILWQYYAEPPPEGKRNWVMNSWCHGAPGTTRLFSLLHRLTGDAAFLATASKGAGGIRAEARLASGKPFFYNPTYCCGAAGCMDALCNVHQASKDKRFLDDARTLADAVLKDLRDAPGGRATASYDEADEETKLAPYFETGFMLGNAGIGYALLRLAALSSGEPEKVLLWPDHPMAWDAKGK
jgi:lantibiotic modifying enzyme